MSENRQNNIPEEVNELTAQLDKPGLSRKDFIRYAGASGAALAALGGLAACEDDPGGVDDGNVVNLGTGDFAVLNYAFALEQFEDEFYVAVLEEAFNTPTAFNGLLEDVEFHEQAHVDFFDALLGDNGIPRLEFDFSSVNLDDQDAVLNLSLGIENTGVAAYNGAAARLSNTEFGKTALLAAGKIVSLEARHCSAFSDLARPMVGVAGNQIFGSEAGSPVINGNGLDIVRTPAEVLSIIDPFVVTDIDASGIPDPS